MYGYRDFNGTFEVSGFINAPDYFISPLPFSMADWNAGIPFPRYEDIWGCLGVRDDREMHIWREATQHFAFLMQKEISHG